MKRAQPIALAPATVTQATSLEVLGIDAPRYLEHLRQHPEIARRRVGRLVVTAVADWLPARELETQPTPAPKRSAWSPDGAIAKAMSR